MTTPRELTGSADAVDVVVVGAGPAGVAAAVVAGESGARVVLLDSSGRAGGQYYRRPVGAGSDGDAAFHPWAAFDELESRLSSLVRRGRVTLLQDTTVWSATGSGPFTVRTRGADRDPRAPLGSVVARTVVVATGAFDRHLPFPGWDVPGVLSGGAAQSLVKESGVLPGARIVVAGTGPFLLAVAATMLEAGGTVAAVIEANRPEALLSRAYRVLPAWARAGDLARFTALLARHRVPYLRRHRVVEAHGVSALESVDVARVDRTWRRTSDEVRTIEADTLAVGFGFTAQLDVALQLGCATVCSADGGLAVRVDAGQRTTVRGVIACGEATGVGGADLALQEGLIAGASAARAVGLRPVLTDAELASARTRVRRLTGFATALHESFPVRPGWQDDLRGDTVVCRCEEVSHAAIGHAIDELGAPDPRTVKLMTRAGMGWCQGRVCGFAVDLMCASRTPDHEPDPAAMTAAARRPLGSPITLGSLAELAEAPSPDALVRDTPPGGNS